MKYKREKIKKRDAEKLLFSIVEYADCASELSEIQIYDFDEPSRSLVTLKTKFDRSEKKLIDLFHEITGWKPVINEKDEWEVER